MKNNAELKALRTTELNMISQDAIDAEFEQRRAHRLLQNQKAAIMMPQPDSKEHKSYRNNENNSQERAWKAAVPHGVDAGSLGVHINDSHLDSYFKQYGTAEEAKQDQEAK